MNGVKAHFIFMDISLPGKDGLMATREIRIPPNYKKTPIVALTAHAMLGWREKCLSAG